jgi:leader peptidase (prepilin peptidase) / N-methyltransferase
VTFRRLQAGAVGAAIFSATGVVDYLGVVSIARLSIMGAALGAAAACDLAEQRIPNWVTVPAAVALLILFAATGTAFGRIEGGLAVAGLLLGICLIRPGAIGMGDAKLAIVVALGLTDKALIGLASGFVLAAIFAIERIARSSSTRGAAIPLGPFLALGALIPLLA